MNCTQAVIGKVSAYVKDKTRDLEVIRAELNAPTVDNPTPQPSVLNPFDFNSVAALIGKDSMGALVKYIHFNQIITDMRNRDREAIIQWSAALAAAAIISAGEAGAIQTALTASVPDPQWKPKISWVESTFGVGSVLTEQDMLDCANYGKWSR